MNRRRMDVEWPDGYDLTQSSTDPAAYRALTHDGEHLGPHPNLYDVQAEEPDGPQAPNVLAQVIAGIVLVGVGVGGTLGVQWVRVKWQARKAARSSPPDAEERPLAEPIVLRPRDSSSDAA